MHEKLKKLREKFKKHNVIIALIVFVTIGTIFCVDTTMKDTWDLMSYPEQEYRNLEIEAYKMIQNKDFSVENKDYNYTITYYNSVDNELKIELEDSDSNTVITKVSNYGKKDEYVKVRRQDEYKVFHYIRWITAIISFVAIISAILYYGIKLLLIVLIPFAFLCDKIIEIINKRKYKKALNDDEYNQNEQDSVDDIDSK